MKTIGFGISLLAFASAGLAQTPPPAPVVGAAVPAAPSPAEAAAATKRNEEAQKAAEKERKAGEERAEEQERQTEKERKATEKRIAEQERLAAEQAAAADAAAAKRAAETAAAASAATAGAAAKPSGDRRDVATQVCLAEAKSRAMAVGATNVTMRDVEDTDEKSDGRASVRAKVNVVSKTSKGKIKTEKKTIKCDTRNGVVTAFEWD